MQARQFQWRCVGEGPVAGKVGIGRHANPEEAIIFGLARSHAFLNPFVLLPLSLPPLPLYVRVVYLRACLYSVAMYVRGHSDLASLRSMICRSLSLPWDGDLQVPTH
jgi:hypothetical protein